MSQQSRNGDLRGFENSLWKAADKLTGCVQDDPRLLAEAEAERQRRPQGYGAHRWSWSLRAHTPVCPYRYSLSAVLPIVDRASDGNRTRVLSLGS
jgi:hypothetical protein